LWYMLRDGAYKGGRDDQLGMRFTTVTGVDAGSKPVWDVFSAAASSGADVPLPPALPDSGPYVAPPALAPATPPVTTARTPVKKQAAKVTDLVVVKTRRARGGLTLLVTCVRPGATCKGSARLRLDAAVAASRGTKARTVGSRSWRAGGGKTTTLRIRVNRAGKALLKRGRSLRVHVVVSARDSNGNSAQLTSSATVR
jgi:hypothetical protein